MKKIISIIITFIFCFSLLGCSRKKITPEAALKKVNIKVSRIYYTVNLNKDLTAVFYQDKETLHRVVGIFNNKKDGLHFVTSTDLQSAIEFKQDLTYAAVLRPKTKSYEGFTLEYGAINNPMIAEVNLSMDGKSPLDDRKAEIIDLDGIRVWYTFINEYNKIFNYQQGISKDGVLIYSY